MRDIKRTFEKHLVDVEKLTGFEKEVMQLAISNVEDLHRRLKKNQGIENEQMNGGRVLQLLKTIRDNESLKPRFALIFNQAIVLLVSYFGSAVEDIFSKAVTARLRSGTSGRLLKEDVKVSMAELLDVAGAPMEAIAELLIEKKDLSFQDMQAIQRAFREYVGIEMEKDESVNDIILAQACRHVIVHAGGEITPRLTKQVAGAAPRGVKQVLPEAGLIQFSETEVKHVARSMQAYVHTLVAKTEAALGV